MVVFVGKLEVVHKQGGGDLISYNLQHSRVRKIEVILPYVRARALPRRSLWKANYM